MTPPSVAVLGGGLAGMAAAYALALAGARRVTLLERGPELGGLAGTFEIDGRFYPLAYHHILHRDRTLLFFLDRIGALERVRWRKIRMLFRTAGGTYDLARPGDFLRFPMGALDKLRFVRLMLRAFFKEEWDDWNGRSAAELVDAWGGPGVRAALFESLCRLKFDRPCSAVSGAWLGARLHYREGSSPLGYIPSTNWTKVLCDGLTARLEQAGVTIRLRTTVRALHGDAGALREVELVDGERVAADAFVSTLPTEVYRTFAPGDATPELASIRYTAVVSAIFTTRQRLTPDFYWMNLPTLDRNACGVFLLDALNPTIGAPGERCVNFVTHVPHREHEFFLRDDETLLRGYHDDFHAIFGTELSADWTRLVKLPLYSPVFGLDYRNPPVRSTGWPNVYFAGNFRTFPSIVSTGTALGSGLEAARALLADRALATPLPDLVRAFRLRSRPRG